MKFQIETKTLKKALEMVNHATASISTTPILENILIKVNFSNIVFVSNNLEMAVEHIISNNMKIDTEGTFCVPSKIFTSYVNLIEDENVNIELINEDSLEIKTQTSNIKIKGNKSEEFPLIPTIKENESFVLSSDILRKSIEKTLFSSAEGNIRPTLAGIYVNIENNLVKFATTDSFRLSEYKTEFEKNFDGNFSQIIPNKTAYELKSVLGEKFDVKIIISENQIGFIFQNTKFYSRLLNGNFPEYEGFFPNNFNTESIINRYDLIGGLRKINLLSKEINYSIKMSFSKDNKILLETSETQSGEANVDLIGTVDGEEAVIGLNSEYFLEVLGVIDTTHVKISFESPLSPILITGISEKDNKKDSSFKHIIMPLKI